MKLFQPLNINGMVIQNRIMVPAMVTRLSGEDGVVNQDIIDRYVRYAQGEAGLIVVEAMAVHHSKSGPLLRISDDTFVPGLASLARRIHDTSGSKVVPQIIHFLKVAKSGWRQTVDMLSLEDIDRIVDEFGDAVARAREAASMAPNYTRPMPIRSPPSCRGPTSARTSMGDRPSRDACASSAALFKMRAQKRAKISLWACASWRMSSSRMAIRSTMPKSSP